MDPSDKPEIADIATSPTERPKAGAPGAVVWHSALIEMVHLLGVYFTHARNSHGQRATKILFEQIVQRAALLEQMPGQDGRLVMRRVTCNGARALPKTDYSLCMGPVHFQIAAQSVHNAGLQTDGPRAVRLVHLERTFAFFEKLAVPGLAIRFPGATSESIEQLRLALEIVSRYPTAIETKSDLVFALLGRPRKVALVQNARGHPDLGLTLLGGVNGLSAVNVRELVKRADEQPVPPQDWRHSGEDWSTLDSYERIITTPVLSNGLARPLVEVVRGGGRDSGVAVVSGGRSSAAGTVSACDWRFDGIAVPAVASVEGEAAAGFERSIHFLHSCLDAQDEKGRAALERLVRTDWAHMGIEELFSWIDSAITTRRLAGNDRRTRPLVERLDAFLLQRLGCAPAALWAQVALRGTSITLGATRGHSLMLGMVPEAVRQAVAVVRERVMCPRKLAYIVSHTDPYQPLDPCTIASLFGVSRQEAGQVVKMAAACFHDPTGLGRRFQADPILWNDACQNVLVQILWCHLRGTMRSQSHMPLLGGLHLQVVRLRESAPFLNFLLTNLAFSAGHLSAADHDAMTLCTLLLQGRDNNAGVGFTDASVLEKSSGPSAVLRRYVSWRLAIEQPLLTAKFRSLAEALRQGWAGVCNSNVENAGRFAFLLDLQRESLIFLALAGGKTARRLIRDALQRMLDQSVALDMAAMPSHWRQAWLEQLNLVLRTLRRVALPQDSALLESVGKECGRRLHQFAPVERDAMIVRVTQGIERSKATNKAACGAHAAG